MRVAVLDLGSNSFRMLVADAGPGTQITRVLLEREMLHLGGIVGTHGLLPDDAIDAAADAVRHLVDLASRTSVDRIEVVATSAIRDASNQATVITALEDAAGVPLRVLSGEEEAQTSFAGVRGAVGIEDEPIVVLDLGGGSLEVVTGDMTGVLEASSYPLGVSRLHAEHVTTDPMGPSVRANLRRAVETAIPSGRYPDRVIAVGGTVRALAEVYASRARSWVPPSLNLLTIPTDAIGVLAATLSTMTSEERADVPGMRESRAEHIATAAVILHQALIQVGADTFHVSDWGLREGIVLEDHAKGREFAAHRLRRAEVEALMTAFGPGNGHAEFVANLGLTVFDALAEPFGLDSGDRELVEFALLVHDIGKVLAVSGYQRHSAYLVENAELRGFTPTEIAVLATLVRFSRSGRPKASFAPYHSLLPTWEQRLARLTAIVQLADGLDWAADQTVESVTVEPGSDAVTVRVTGHDTVIRRDVSALAAHRFARAFGVPLRIVAPEMA